LQISENEGFLMMKAINPRETYVNVEDDHSPSYSWKSATERIAPAMRGRTAAIPERRSLPVAALVGVVAGDVGASKQLASERKVASCGPA